MMQGTFFALGILLASLAGHGSLFLAGHGTMVYLLNATSGLVASQQDLGERVVCAVPASQGFVVATTANGITHIVYFFYNGTYVPITNIMIGNESMPSLTGTATDCAPYEGYVALVLTNGTSYKLYVLKVTPAEAMVEEEAKAMEPSVSGGMILVNYGNEGLYVFTNGKFVELVEGKIKAAATAENNVFYVANNTLYMVQVKPPHARAMLWKPQGNITITSVLALSDNKVVVGLDKTTLGVEMLVVKGGKAYPKVSVGVPNVYMLALSKEYVGAATKGGQNLSPGVALVPISWFETK